MLYFTGASDWHTHAQPPSPRYLIHAFIMSLQPGAQPQPQPTDLKANRNKSYLSYIFFFFGVYKFHKFLKVSVTSTEIQARPFTHI